MLQPDERKRYSRQILIPEIGLTGQERLKNARVLVIGAGGLGCPVLQYLAAAGVGHLGIVDNDTVDMTNLHRQILFNAADVGLNKSICAAEKLAILNPHISIQTYPVRLSEENAVEIFETYDLIIDGSDNFPTRYLVDNTCIALNKPMVFGSILRFEGQVSVFNYQNGPTYRSLFADADEGDNCEVAGVMNVLPGIIGTYMATEAIKIICQIGEVLSGKLLVINTLTQSSQIFHFAPNTEILSQNSEQKVSEKTAPLPPGKTGQATQLLTYEEFEALQQSEQTILVDVREDYEFEADNFGGTNIPLSEIPDHIASFSPDVTVVFYCQSGKRSETAAKLLTNSGFNGKFYIAGKW